MNTKIIEYDAIQKPKLDCSLSPVLLTDKTLLERKERILQRMIEHDYDALVIYADPEHGSNFEYLVGYIPRFEEACLILHRDGKAFLMFGNENLNKVDYSRIPAEALHAPQFSLPNQPMTNYSSLEGLFMKAGIHHTMKIGLVGYKLFTINLAERKTFDIPYYVMNALFNIVEPTLVENATFLFISPENGARIQNNANEIAHYEFFSSLASDCMLKTMDKIELGISEMELGNSLNAYGQYNSVVTIAATGNRFEKGNLYPTNKKLCFKDKISLTVGYKGGLSSRSGYLVNNEDEIGIPYLDNLVKPYYATIVAWLEHIHCGMTGKELYDLVEESLPQSKFNWTLNPGHLTADEEWLCSPIYPESTCTLKSGMILQTDIIPTLEGFSGTSVESTIAIADKELQNQLEKEYPELWNRFMNRRKYMEEVLNIQLRPDVLPMASTVGYLRPFLLNKECALKVK